MSFERSLRGARRQATRSVACPPPATCLEPKVNRGPWAPWLCAPMNDAEARISEREYEVELTPGSIAHPPGPPATFELRPPDYPMHPHAVEIACGPVSRTPTPAMIAAVSIRSGGPCSRSTWDAADRQRLRAGPGQNITVGTVWVLRRLAHCNISVGSPPQFEPRGRIRSPGLEFVPRGTAEPLRFDALPAPKVAVRRCRDRASSM